MTKKVLIISTLLILISLVTTLYKALVLKYSFFPELPGDLWLVDYNITFQGRGKPGKIKINLPLQSPSQRVFDERFSSEGIRFFIRESGRGGINRICFWAGILKGTKVFSYRFLLKVKEVRYDIPEKDGTKKYPPQIQPWLNPTHIIPFQDHKIMGFMKKWSNPAMDKVKVVKSVYNFMVKEVNNTRSNSDSDPIKVLETLEGNSLGKARLFAALLMAAGIPARLVGGLILEEGRTKRLHIWNEVYLKGVWLPFCTVNDHFGVKPGNYLVLRKGGVPIVLADNVKNFSYSFNMIEERQILYDQYLKNIGKKESFFNRYSLFSFPTQSQVVFRVLLTVPIGALIVCICRNMIGIPTFGTFMPVLLALAFRDTTLPWGLLLLSIIVILGVGARYILDKLQLLMISRLSVLLTFVIISMITLSIIGLEVGSTKPLSVALFPFVIMTMVIERFSITLEEEGLKNTLRVTLGTVVVSSFGYLIISPQRVQLLLFTFPEMLLIAMGIMLLIGRYTGYRLAEYLRFRVFILKELRIQREASDVA